MNENWKRRAAIAILADVSKLNEALGNLVRELGDPSEIVIMSDKDVIGALKSKTIQDDAPSNFQHSLEFITISDGNPHQLGADKPVGRTTALVSVVTDLADWLTDTVAASLIQHVTGGASVLFVSVESAIAEATIFRTLLRSCIGKIQVHDLPE